VLLILIAGLAAYKSVHFCKAVWQRFAVGKFVQNEYEPWVAITLSMGFGVLYCAVLDVQKWIVSGLAAAAIAGVLHILLRLLFHLSTLVQAQELQEALQAERRRR
jgi:hypothetical protein